jgi:hypothetical protein
MTRGLSSVSRMDSMDDKKGTSSVLKCSTGQAGTLREVSHARRRPPRAGGSPAVGRSSTLDIPVPLWFSVKTSRRRQRDAPPRAGGPLSTLSGIPLALISPPGPSKISPGLGEDHPSAPATDSDFPAQGE